MFRKLIAFAVKFVATSEVRDAIKKRIEEVESRPLTGLQKFDFVRQFARNLLKEHAGIVVDTLVQALVFLTKAKG